MGVGGIFDQARPAYSCQNEQIFCHATFWKALHRRKCLCGVVVMNPDWESVGCEFKYRN